MNLFEWFKGSTKEAKPAVELNTKSFSAELVPNKVKEVVRQKERTTMWHRDIEELLAQTAVLLKGQNNRHLQEDLERLSHILLADSKQQEQEQACLLAFGYYLSKREENSYHDRYYRNLQHAYFRKREALRANLSTVCHLYEAYQQLGLNQTYYLMVNDMVCFYKDSLFLNYLNLEHLFTKLGMEPKDDQNAYEENFFTLSFYELSASTTEEVLQLYRQSEPLISKKGSRQLLLEFMRNVEQHIEQLQTQQHR